MAFLIQCALVRSEPRCSRSIAALLNKGSFLPSSQYYAKLAWIRGRVLVPIGPHTSHVTLHPAFPLAAVFNLPTLSARLYPAAATGYTGAYSLSSFSTLYRRSIRSKPWYLLLCLVIVDRTEYNAILSEGGFLFCSLGCLFDWPGVWVLYRRSIQTTE